VIVLVLVNAQTGELNILAEGDGTTPANVTKALVGAAQIARKQEQAAAQQQRIIPAAPPTPNIRDILNNGGPQ